MNDLWQKINEEVPKYMKKACQKYGLKCEIVTDNECILYNDKSCLLIQLDRFDVHLGYIINEKGNFRIYSIGNYIAMRYDAQDRQNLIIEEKAGDCLRNDLSVIASGLTSKCEDLFTGELKWFEKYKCSCFFNEKRLDLEIEDYLIKNLKGLNI